MQQVIKIFQYSQIFNYLLSQRCSEASNRIFTLIYTMIIIIGLLVIYVNSYRKACMLLVFTSFRKNFEFSHSSV
jgi:hypothetical protein